MKVLYQFNKIVLIITLILYVTIFLGLYAQIVLGGIQILSAIGITFLWNRFENKYKKQLLIYWLVTLSYGIGWLLEIDLNDSWWILAIIIIPMSIAIYFVWLLSNLKNIQS
ncbi:hypothetical protein [Winogradskyella flava]|uniref:hypothetical protein n=1 Tax=Winogradskyella flava TaxID=1884876 RepID=UPI0024902724|nr:hypothetical protein [Winogradskyella flava]